MEEREYWLGFSVFPGIGPIRFEQLLQSFESIESAWYAPVSDLEDVIGKSIAEKFNVFRSDFSLKTYIENLKKHTVSYLTLSDREYPDRLKQITHPPFVLYVKGAVSSLTKDSRYVGVVGTRRITSYGKQVTETITRELVSEGCVIVSGLALGVDAVAHHTTVVDKGITIAVLGCGVDHCYPVENTRIYDEIVQSNGAIVSEYPLSMPPSKGSFPSRNRIIAGLSEAVIVTEGSADSGALITARNAQEYGRLVFAVPGPITSSLSKGPNSLIGQGAKMVMSSHDILKELKGSFVSQMREEVKGENVEEQIIINLLYQESLSADEIVKRVEMTPSQVLSLLSFMEMKGMIHSLDSGKFGLL